MFLQDGACLLVLVSLSALKYTTPGLRLAGNVTLEIQIASTRRSGGMVNETDHCQALRPWLRVLWHMLDPHLDSHLACQGYHPECHLGSLARSHLECLLGKLSSMKGFHVS